MEQLWKHISIKTYMWKDVLFAVVAVVFGVIIFFVCSKKIKSIQFDHGMELAETHDNTRRLLDNAHNPLEQSQYTIDSLELHLGKRIGAGLSHFYPKTNSIHL